MTRSIRMSFCLRAATTLEPQDLDVLTDAIEAYTTVGMDTKQAELLAVEDVLTRVKTDRSEVFGLVVEQHGEALSPMEQPVLNAPTRADIEDIQASTEQAGKSDQREQVKRESEAAGGSRGVEADGVARSKSGYVEVRLNGKKHFITPYEKYFVIRDSLGSIVRDGANKPIQFDTEDKAMAFAKAGAGDVQADGVKNDVPETNFGNMEPFEHKGLKIRTSRVKVGESVEQRWIVQTPENAEREAKGERQIGGDRILDTREEAIKTADEMLREAASDKAYKEEREAAEKAEREAVEARKAANRGKSITERKADATLDKQVRDSETGQVSTRREWVERKVEAGLTTSKTQEDKIKPMSRMQAFRADNRQSAEHERKVKAAGKKDVHWLGDFEVTKAEYDYANSVAADESITQAPKAGLSSPAAPQTAKSDGETSWSEMTQAQRSKLNIPESIKSQKWDALTVDQQSIVREAMGQGDQLSVAEGQATTTTYTKASETQQTAAKAFAERLSRNKDSYVIMDAVEPSGPRKKEAETIAKMAKTMFGREVVFVKFQSKPLFNGAVSTTDPGKVFLNIETARPMMAVLGHELLHELRKSNPAAYKVLANKLKNVTKDDFIYEALLKKKYANQGLNWVPQDISEELYGDIVGDNFMDPKFWEAIAGDKPILAKQLYRAVMNWLDKIASMFKRMKVRQDGNVALTLAEQADGSRPFGTQKYLTDIEAARAAVAEAMGQFGKAKGGKDSLSVSDKPEQIKSATGNNGNFDGTNPDIRLSVADVVEQIKQFDVKSAPKNTWAHYRGMAMQALGRRQIVDLYSEELPQLGEYDYLVQKMDAEKNDSGAEADEVARKWAGLNERAMVGTGKLAAAIGPEKYPGMDKKLADLMHDATLAQLDPDKPMPADAVKAQYDRLKTQFNALSPNAQALFRQARDMYADHYTAVQKAIKERIERSEMSPSQKKQIMAQMDEKLFQQLKGVYFPLARFGQYVIVVKDANGEVKNVTRAESVNEAEESRKALMKDFPAHMGNTVGKILKQAEFNAGRDAVGKGFMADLMGALDKNGVNDELRDTVAQLYLSSLPDLSWAKHGIHRKGTPGFSQDARRAFAQNMFHGARYLAKLRYSDQLQDQLTEMQEHVKAYEGVDEYDSIEAQQVVDEMVKRHDLMMNPNTSPVSTALTSFGFLFHMGLSPASAMVNLTQTALVAFPQMGAKWGFAKASAALLKASDETVRSKNDLLTTLKGEEREALGRAIKDGTIDVTMAHDLAGIGQGEDQRVMWKIRPVMRAASFMFHHAEKFNRQATFLAAYRLAKEASPSKTFEQLYEEAKTTTYDGHFDYSAGNRPRFMQGNWQKVILLFKSFAQNSVYVLARNAHQSIMAMDPKDRSRARKTLGGLLATHAAAAGVLGLPIVGQLLTVASWIGSDDDEPWDAEVAMQNAMAEMLGKDAAEVMAKGLSRLTPFDISGRVSLNNLILPDVYEGLEGKAWAESAMSAALGPVAGIGVNVARGMQKITDGDYMRGMEDMMPAALRGPMKAFRYANEGAVDKSGIVITDEVRAAGIAGQALGLSPSQVRRDTERRGAIYGVDKALTERRSVLMRMFADARMNGDTETAQEIQADIQSYNEKNPSRKITGQNLMQSIKNRRKRIEQAKNGIYLPKNRRDAIDAVDF